MRNVLGATRLVEEYGDDAVVVSVLADSGKKYLPPDLFATSPGAKGTSHRT